MINKIKEIDDICKTYNIKNYVINKDGSIDVDGDVYLCLEKIKTIPLKFNIVSGNCDFRMNLLNSLKNSPVYVGGDFYCIYNQITSLKYSPREIIRDFNCSDNKLTSLEYGPEKVGRSYYCHDNYLITLKGSIKYVKENFYCSNNELKSLKYSPREIGKHFSCSNNKLKTLEYGPEIVYGSYVCMINELKNLKGCAKCIGGELNIYNNPNLYSLEGLTYYDFKNLNCENTIFYNVWNLFQDISKIELFNDMDIIREDASGKPVIILDRLNEFLDIIGKPKVKYVEGYINI